MEADEYDVEQGGCVCLNLGKDLLCSASVSHAICVRYVGLDTLYWEVLGGIPTYSGPQADVKATSERKGWRMGLPPTGGRDCEGGIKVGRNLHLLPL